MSMDWLAIKRVINNDAKSRYLYLDETDKTCVIGGLARQANIPIPSNDDDNGYTIQNLPEFATALTRAYGLNSTQLLKLQRVNDKYTTIRARRAALLRLIEGWERADNDTNE